MIGSKASGGQMLEVYSGMGKSQSDLTSNRVREGRMMRQQIPSRSLNLEMASTHNTQRRGDIHTRCKSKPPMLGIFGDPFLLRLLGRRHGPTWILSTYSDTEKKSTNT
jgi:hypothetical protein